MSSNAFTTDNVLEDADRGSRHVFVWHMLQCLVHGGIQHCYSLRFTVNSSSHVKNVCISVDWCRLYT